MAWQWMLHVLQQQDAHCVPLLSPHKLCSVVRLTWFSGKRPNLTFIEAEIYCNCTLLGAATSMTTALGIDVVLKK